VVFDIKITIYEGVVAIVDFVEVADESYALLLLADGYLLGEDVVCRLREVVALFVAEIVALRELQIEIGCASAIDILQAVEVYRNFEWCAEWVLIAAKLYNELGDFNRKEALLEAAASYNSSAEFQQEINLVRSAPLGTKTAL
jgi:hypothetical protein